MKADLHFHSTYSDGKLTPKELIELLKAQGVDFACLTDHDSLMGSEEFVNLAKENGIISYPAVELSTYRNSESIHVLGYFKSIDSITDSMKDYLLHMLENRRNRMKVMVENVNKIFGFHVDYEKILNEHPYMIERPHLADEISKETGLDISDIFKKYIGDDSPAYVRSSKISTEEGIKMIKDAGGIAVLAHPYQYKKNDPKEILKAGCDGCEVFYFPQKEKKYKQYRKFSRKNNLLMTGGSDFHRLNDRGHSYIGSKDFDSEYMKELIERIEKL